jgi:diguanylate cyclase (GGDEF)-like protein
MPIVDKETGELEGVLSAFQVQRRQWQSNEVYLLKAVADQVEIAVSHLKLRSLMKSLSVTDGGTGLLSRSSYLDALTSEVARAKTQGTPLVLSLLELDKGTHWLRNVGEETIQKFMQQAGETLLSQMRPNDIAFRYTTTALAWVMVDTTTEKVKSVVERLRRQLNSLKLPGTRDGHSFSAGVSEAAIRPDYDPLDIVTDVINRAEFSLEDARKKGNTTVTR